MARCVELPCPAVDPAPETRSSVVASGPALDRVDPRGPPRLRARFGDLRLPWVPLGSFPTPVEPLEGLSRALGSECWIKRDDRSSAAYGGNKVRKLELLLGRALARGRETVVTLGAYGSHHALATTVHARALGLEVELALYPQPITPHVLDDLLLDHALGARLTRIPHPALGPLATATLAARARRGEVVPPGGSSGLGTVGYVEAALELERQVAAGALPEPDAIVVAAGTCGTAAGLALGLELAGLHRTRVIGVRVVPASIANRMLLAQLDRVARRVLREAGARLPSRRASPVRLDTEELGAGYGVETEAGRDAVRRFGDLGVELEGTYTGKAAAAFLRLAAGELRGQRLLFWHTYSSVDLTPRLRGLAPGALPAAFHAALREGGRL